MSGLTIWPQVCHWEGESSDVVLSRATVILVSKHEGWGHTQGRRLANLVGTQQAATDVDTCVAPLLVARPQCQGSFQGFGEEHLQVTGTHAAAREPSVGLFRFTPKILSAIHKNNRRRIPPNLISGSGRPRSRNSQAVRWSLRSARTIPPRLECQSLFRRTHSALAGAAGVDSKTGAAIHHPAAPGESD